MKGRTSSHTVLVRIGASTPSPTLPVISSLAVNPRSFSTAVAGPSVTQLVLTDDAPVVQTGKEPAIDAQMDKFSHQNGMTGSEQDALVASRDGHEIQISTCSEEKETMTGTINDIQQKDNDSSDTDAFQEQAFYCHKDVIVQNTQTPLSDHSEIDEHDLEDSAKSFHHTSIIDSQEDDIHRDESREHHVDNDEDKEHQNDNVEKHQNDNAASKVQHHDDKDENTEHHSDNDTNTEHPDDNADGDEYPVDNAWSTEHCKEHRTANASRVESRTAEAEMRGLETRLADISTTNNILQKELTSLEAQVADYEGRVGRMERDGERSLLQWNLILGDREAVIANLRDEVESLERRLYISCPNCSDGSGSRDSSLERSCSLGSFITEEEEEDEQEQEVFEGEEKEQTQVKTCAQCGGSLADQLTFISHQIDALTTIMVGDIQNQISGTIHTIEELPAAAASPPYENQPSPYRISESSSEDEYDDDGSSSLGDDESLAESVETVYSWKGSRVYGHVSEDDQYTTLQYNEEYERSSVSPCAPLPTRPNQFNTFQPDQPAFKSGSCTTRICVVRDPADRILELTRQDRTNAATTLYRRLPPNQTRTVQVSVNLTSTSSQTEQMTCADRLTSDSSGQMTSDEDRLTSNSEVARLLEEQERLVLRLEDRLEDRENMVELLEQQLRAARDLSEQQRRKTEQQISEMSVLGRQLDQMHRYQASPKTSVTSVCSVGSVGSSLAESFCDPEDRGRRFIIKDLQSQIQSLQEKSTKKDSLIRKLAESVSGTDTRFLVHAIRESTTKPSDRRIDFDINTLCSFIETRKISVSEKSR